MSEILRVDSSTIKGIGYQAETENRKSRLVVIFNSGAQYTYEGVPLDLWERFKEAESVGQFFIREIKSTFRGVKQ